MDVQIISYRARVHWKAANIERMVRCGGSLELSIRACHAVVLTTPRRYENRPDDFSPSPPG
jgi:hypothetical protein